MGTKSQRYAIKIFKLEGEFVRKMLEKKMNESDDTDETEFARWAADELNVDAS
jgi:hypothetical protein